MNDDPLPALPGDPISTAVAGVADLYHPILRGRDCRPPTEDPLRRAMLRSLAMAAAALLIAIAALVTASLQFG